MATYALQGYAQGTFTVVSGTGGSVGDRVRLDPTWTASEDMINITVTDDDTTFEGDSNSGKDEIGNDSNQTAVITDAYGTTIDSGQVYLEDHFVFIDGDGNTINLYTVEIAGAYRAYVTDAPLTPGVTYEISAITNVTGTNDPQYSDIDAPTYEAASSQSYDGGAFADSIESGGGSDTISGDGGDDTIVSGAGQDSISGGTGNDTILYGEGGATQAEGNYVSGGDGNDVMDDVGGTSHVYDDTLYGDAGNDTIWAGGGDDSVHGGDDNDMLFGEDGADTIHGDAGADYIDGGTGNDFVLGGTGNDTLHGGDGDDYVSGDAGDDELYGDAGNDTIWTISGHDTVYGGDGNDSIDDQLGEITAVYNSYYDGGTGNDTIWAGGGVDTILGGDGDDVIYGEGGNDVLTGGAGYDTFGFWANSGADTINDFDMGDDDADGRTNDQLDVSQLRDLGNNPVDWQDVTVSDDGSGNAVLSFPNGEQMTLLGVAPTQVTTKQQLAKIGVPCFASGTRILTPTGERKVEDLVAGDLVCTLHHGPQPLRWAGHRTLSRADLQANPKLAPIRIRDGVLGNRGDLLVSPQHAMKLGGKLCRAAHLADHGGGRIRRAYGKRGVTYVHLLLPRHEIIFANGAPTESLYPGRFGLAGFDVAAKSELIALFPQLGFVMRGADPGKVYGPPALPFAKGGALRREAAAHGAIFSQHRMPDLPPHGPRPVPADLLGRLALRRPQRAATLGRFAR